jgi:hypothetical protein
MLYTFDSTTFIKDIQIKKCFTQLQREADNALYEAKFTGKNRWSTFSPKKLAVYAKCRRQYKK